MIDRARFRVTKDVACTPVLVIDGQIDDGVVADFQRTIEDAESRTPCGLVVSLAEAQLLCSAAYSVLTGVAARLAKSESGPLVVVCPEAHLANRVLRLLQCGHQRVDSLVAAFLAVRCNGKTLAVTHAERLLRANAP